MSPKASKTAKRVIASAPVEPTEEPALASPPSEQEVAELAYQRWVERGCPIGSPEEDWFAAWQQLQSRPKPS